MSKCSFVEMDKHVSPNEIVVAFVAAIKSEIASFARDTLMHANGRRIA